MAYKQGERDHNDHGGRREMALRARSGATAQSRSSRGDPLLYPDRDYSDRINSKAIPAKGGNGSNYVRKNCPSIRGKELLVVALLDSPNE